MSVLNSTITGTTATQAAVLSRGTTSLSGTTLSNNTTNIAAISNVFGTLNLTNCTISNNKTSSYAALVNQGTANFSGTNTFTYNLSGASYADIYNLGAGKTINLNNSTLNLQGDFYNDSGTWNSGTSTVNCNGDNQSLAPITFFNLITSNSGTKSLTGDTTVSGDLTVGAGTTIQGVSTLDVTGNATINGDIGGIADPTSFSVGGDTTMNTDNISTAGPQTYTGNVTLSKDVQLSANSGSSETIWFQGTVNGEHSLTINDNGRFEGTVGDSALLTSLSVLGETVVNDNISTAGTQDYTGIIYLMGSGARLFKTNDSPINFNDGINGVVSSVGITIDAGSSDVTLAAGKSIEVNRLITKNGSGNFITNGGNLTAKGLSVTGGIFNSGNAAGTWDIGTDGVSISSGATLNATSGNFTDAGNFSNSGNFGANSGVFIIDGSGTSTISGTTIFNDFRCITGGKTLTFATGAGNSQTVNGNFRVSGIAGNLLIINSDTPGTMANINIANPTMCSFVNVRDSNNSGTMINPSSAVNGGNTIGWFATYLITLTPYHVMYLSSSSTETGNPYDTRNTGSLWQWTISESTAGDTITGSPVFATDATTTTNAGTHNATGYVSGLTSSMGRSFTLASGTGTGAYIIDPGTLTYTANTSTREEGAVNQTFTGTVTGFLGGQTVSTGTTGTLAFTSPATTSSPVGTYAINGSGLTSPNYTFVQASGNASALTVTPATSTPAPANTSDVITPVQQTASNLANNGGSGNNPSQIVNNTEANKTTGINTVENTSGTGLNYPGSFSVSIVNPGNNDYKSSLLA